MFIVALNLKSLLVNLKRTLVFVCLIALLCTITGLLGNYFLYANFMDPVNIILVDEDKSSEGEFFYSILSKMETYKKFITFEKMDRDLAVEKLKANEANAIFIIPEKFTEYVKNGVNEPYEVIYNSSMAVKTELIKNFSDAFMKMLKASQIGVYTALDYTRENGTAEQNDSMFRAINLKYISMVLDRESFIQYRSVSATGDLPIFQYYFWAFYIFIMFAAVMLFTDILQKNSKRNVLLTLAKSGNGSVKIAFFNMLSYVLYFVFINLILGLILFWGMKLLKLQIDISPVFLLYITLIIAAVSTFGIAVGYIFKNVFGAGVFVSIYSIAALFLSGGIIPMAYFSEALKFLGKFSFNYWAMGLFRDGYMGKMNYGNLLAVVLYTFVFFAIAVYSVHRKSRVGERI